MPTVGQSVRFTANVTFNENAQLGGKAHLSGSTYVGGNARVDGHATVGGNAYLDGDVVVTGNAFVGGRLTGTTRVDGHAYIGPGVHLNAGHVSGRAMVRRTKDVVVMQTAVGPVTIYPTVTLGEHLIGATAAGKAYEAPNVRVLSQRIGVTIPDYLEQAILQPTP